MLKHFLRAIAQGIERFDSHSNGRKFFPLYRHGESLKQMPDVIAFQHWIGSRRCAGKRLIALCCHFADLSTMRACAYEQEESRRLRPWIDCITGRFER